MTTCASCGWENAGSSLRCEHCGAALPHGVLPRPLTVSAMTWALVSAVLLAATVIALALIEH